ncbi:uncharacterized protein LOC105933568 [Fundulus heteroclitus]|uniref:uncharacterized protein LOC105933568 n=1 Tax=Fundulus heteroclitus TaxID=8078 RepID=UPI00165B6B8C|nr:uncharacterized protein LOC105933568 [Fundulus heteroclitus]
MRLLACSVLVLCLSACSGRKVIFTDVGASISLSCYSDGCPTDKNLYLYHELDKKEEVLFSHSKTPNAAPRLMYQDRIQTNNSARNFTISNLTVNDAGIYTCAYTEPGSNIICNIYAVFIKEVPVPCELKTPSNPSPPPTTFGTEQPLVMYIVFICVIVVLAMWIVFLLIIPRVKGWCERRRRRRAQCAPTVYVDNVYETMTKNQGDPIPEAQTLSV